MGRWTVQRLNSSPPALNWLMASAMKKVEQWKVSLCRSDAEWYFECSWWSLTNPVPEFEERSIMQVVTFYQKPLYENVGTPCHIAALTSRLFLCLCQSLENWKLHMVNMSIIQQILEHGKQIFCSYFKRKSSAGDESDICARAFKKTWEVCSCVWTGGVKDTVKFSLPKHIFTSVLRPWVVL